MIIKNPAESNVVGVVVQLNEAKDTTSISIELNEYLKDCAYSPLEGIFKNEIYKKENYQSLFNVDSNFISNQPGLDNLKQLLVCKIEFTQKTEASTDKKIIWITFSGRWIMLKPLKKLHDFYYYEKITSTGDPVDYNSLVSFLAAQMHLKFCVDVNKYITTKN